jgi:hypothetical protein
VMGEGHPRARLIAAAALALAAMAVAVRA